MKLKQAILAEAVQVARSTPFLAFLVEACRGVARGLEKAAAELETDLAEKRGRELSGGQCTLEQQAHHQTLLPGHRLRAARVHLKLSELDAQIALNVKEEDLHRYEAVPFAINDQQADALIALLKEWDARSSKPS